MSPSQGSSDGSPDSIAEFVDGDPRAAALLRSSLGDLRRRLADEPGNAALREGIGRVLEGRLSLRELAADPELRLLADRGMTEVQHAWHALRPEERARLVAEGRAADHASGGSGEERR
ncbi:hypothetical protein [Nocardioides flavescens]|uniref:Uncharacterized protein n=1 Tax=Nocardioides flavescens TaxID=2691959 RepID=A0A6L7F3Y0_9ACTN|nr:hypothetical protein [Nocardioides flavescens]MXG91950.1 hypothetical protein [Nocardioides flavescens]